MKVSLKWNQWVQELSELEHLHIPRCYSDLPLGQNAKVELHAFGDASEVADASAVYLRVVHEDGKVSTSLVMSCKDPSGSCKEDYPSALRVDGCYNYC